MIASLNRVEVFSKVLASLSFHVVNVCSSLMLGTLLAFLSSPHGENKAQHNLLFWKLIQASHTAIVFEITVIVVGRLCSLRFHCTHECLLTKGFSLPYMREGKDKGTGEEKRIE